MVSVESVGIQIDSRRVSSSNKNNPFDTAFSFDVAIVGAGWAGLAAAVRAAQAGHKVALFDSAPQGGGRARKCTVRFAPDCEIELDNGQHLLIGAYTECVRLIAEVGGQTLQRSAMRLQSTSGLNIESPTLNAFLRVLPANLIRGLGFLKAKGLSLKEKLSVCTMLVKLELNRWKVSAGVITVADLLTTSHQSLAIQKKFWMPLCVATMNTPAHTADATTFCTVLRDSLGSAKHEASDFLTPTTHLSAAFPDAALAWLLARPNSQCSVFLRTTVLSLEATHSDETTHCGWRLNKAFQARHVVLALPPINTARLLDSMHPKPVHPNPVQADSAPHTKAMREFEYLPIATVYLAWRGELNLPKMLMLSDDLAAKQPGQWLFDRGSFTTPSGVVTVAAVVISAWDSVAADVSSNDALALVVNRQINQQVQLPLADYTSVIVEKRATFACTANRPRLTAASLQTNPALHNIWLAGDFAYGDYPATLEGAVRSGIAAAALITPAPLVPAPLPPTP